MMLRVLDLFSGIGGFSLGLERTGGFKTVAFCEIEEFPRKVLAKHWPDVPIYHDIRELTGEKLQQDGIVTDVVTGGFPCQDISVAGKRAGIKGERSGLWTELCRIIGEVRPRYAIVENVANLLSGPSEQRGGWFGRVLGDLAEIGYDAEWHCIPASAVGTDHVRERIWVVAHSHEIRWDATGQYIDRSHVIPRRQVWTPPAPIRNRRDVECRLGALMLDRIGASHISINGRKNDGISDELDRIASLGNSVVPQIPELIGRAILEANP